MITGLEPFCVDIIHRRVGTLQFVAQIWRAKVYIILLTITIMPKNGSFIMGRIRDSRVYSKAASRLTHMFNFPRIHATYSESCGT